MADDIPEFLGVAPDPRTEEAKAQDFSHEEIAPAAAAPVQWVEKPPAEWRYFSKRNQAFSSSCMAHSGVKTLGVENVVEEGVFVELSALPVYRFRGGYPSQGMWQQNLFDLLSKPTACKEDQAPSMGMTEDAMNAPFTLTDAMKQTADFYRANGYFLLDPKNIDEIASILDKGKAVHLMTFFTGDEYWQHVPTVLHPDITNPGDSRVGRHGISAVDRTLYQGEKALIIEDSAGNESSIDGKGQRIITESWLKARIYGAGYLAYRQNASDAHPKPQVTFDRNRPLTFGMKHDPDVSNLQRILQFEGFLTYSVDNEPLPLGNMLQMTCTALKKWQVAHGILDFANEPDVRKVRFGPKSADLANQLYA